MRKLLFIILVVFAGMLWAPTHNNLASHPSNTVKTSETIRSPQSLSSLPYQNGSLPASHVQPSALIPAQTRAPHTVQTNPPVQAPQVTKKLSVAQDVSIVVHTTIPETLVLYRNGKAVFSSPVNTGVPAAPTTYGTFRIYRKLKSQTMSGTNPDGMHYRDPGVPWVMYFYRGEAIHGFVRRSYGFPQSVGCVELPPAKAKELFPLIGIGTPVTIER